MWRRLLGAISSSLVEKKSVSDKQTGSSTTTFLIFPTIYIPLAFDGPTTIVPVCTA